MKAKLNGLSNMIIGFMYSMILNSFMAVILYPEVPVPKILSLSAVAYGLMSLFFIARLSRILFFVFSGFSTMVITFLCWVETPYSEPVLDIVEGIIELWYRIVYDEPRQSAYMMKYAHVFMVFSALVAALIVVLLFNKSNSFFILTGATLAMALFSYYMTAKESRWLFALFCILTILSYVRHVYVKKKKQGLAAENLPMGNFMLFTIPFAILLVLIVSFIPKDERPIEWPWLDTKIMTAIDTFEQRFSSTNMEFFSLSSTGFNGRTQRLGGPIRPNNTAVMDVKALKRTYLRGAVYTLYANNSWMQNANSTRFVPGFMENESDLGETQTGWSNIPVGVLFPDSSDDDKQLLQNLSEGNLIDILFPDYSLEIKFRNMSTRTVFMPLKSLAPVMMSNKPMVISQDTHGAAITSPKLSSGSTYKLNYIQPMYGDPLLKKALTFSRRGLYADAINALTEELQDLIREEELKVLQSVNSGENRSDGQIIHLTSPEIKEIVRKIDTLGKLDYRASNIVREYTLLDAAIPKRVKHLAQQLTEACRSDYERVISVENYLRNNFSYTINTRRVPLGRDFVDYFLFEDKQGYCTYFSTAMTVLLRSLNIPARYVEGYVLPEKSNKDNLYIVTNKNAHAWVEVYFEGFGWMTFEPTPTYAGAMDFMAETESASAEYYPNMPEIENLMDYYRQYEEPGYSPADDIQGRQTSFGRYLAYMPWILVGLLFLSYILNILFTFVYTLRMKGLKGGKKVIRLYEMMLNWFSHVGLSVKPGETAGEFSKRIDRMYCFSESDFTAITYIFVKVRYGNHGVSLEELKLMEHFVREVRQAIIKELGIKRYMPLRVLILGI